MPTTTITSGFPKFNDKHGNPLEGKLWFGVPFLNPKLSPTPIFWDNALTQPAVQPITVESGYILRGGSPAGLFTAGDYSVFCEQDTGEMVYYAQTSKQFDNSTNLSDQLVTITNLSDKTNMSYGVSMIGGASRVISIVADLRTLPKTGAPLAHVLGYYSKNDGGSGSYFLDLSDTSSSDNGGTVIVASDGGRWKLLHNGVISIKQWGAKGDNVADDGVFINQFFAFCTTNGIKAYIPQGTYKSTIQIVLPLQATTASATTGFTIEGIGVSRAVFNVSSVVTSPQFYGFCSGTGTGMGTLETFYLRMSGIGIQGNTSGVVFQLGRDDFNDIIHSPDISINVQNYSTTLTGRGVQLNYVSEAKDLILNVSISGGGQALSIRQLTSSVVKGKFSTILGTSITLKDGFNLGNTFQGCYFFGSTGCVEIQNSNTISNTFIGGIWNYKGYGISASAGGMNRVINPQVDPNTPATYSTFIVNSIGLLVQSAEYRIPLFTPTLPPSNVPMVNTTGRQVVMHAWSGGSGTITAVVINGYTIMMPTGTYILHPQDSVYITYSGVINWVWFELF